MIEDVLGKDPLAPLWAKAYESAEMGDYPGVLFAWRALAQKGVWQLFARIGELYERGALGVEVDIEQALYWYRKAVFEADDPIAHIGLGRAYCNGSGVGQDYRSALHHFQRALASNVVEANIYLGILYYQGAGVERDIVRAERLFVSATKAEYPAAFAYLARITYERGKYLSALLHFLRGTILGIRIAGKDRADPRLLGLGIEIK